MADLEDHSRYKRAKTAPSSVENPTSSTTSTDAVAASIEKPATTKALNTNELLQLILSKVLHGNRLHIRRVSRAWKNAIGFQAKPIDVHCRLEQLEESWIQGNIVKIPHYSADIDFEINPALADQSKPYKGRMGVLPHDFESNGPPTTVSIDESGLAFTVNFDIMSDSEVAKLKAREHEFLIKPPITRLLAQSFLSRTRCQFRKASGSVTYCRLGSR